MEETEQGGGREHEKTGCDGRRGFGPTHDITLYSLHTQLEQTSHTEPSQWV